MIRALEKADSGEYNNLAKNNETKRKMAEIRDICEAIAELTVPLLKKRNKR